VWHNGGEYVEFDYMYQSGKNRLDMIVDWANQEVYEFEWDSNGNMTSLEALYGNTLYNITGTSYSWRNQPLSITRSGNTYNYRYDHQGHRVYKQEGSNIHTLRGAYGEVLAVYSGGSLTHWNIMRPDGTVIGRRESGGTRKYYHRDHLGSTRAVVTAAGSVTEVYDYMPFGDMMDGRITTSSGGAREKFTSHEFDDEVNLYYMQWRRYIPRFGVFTGVDPHYFYYLNLSPYVYAGNNPLIFIDPDGRDIYRFDRKTGEMILEIETDDDFDQVGRFKYDKKNDQYVLRTNRKGEGRIAIDNIDKGILHDGINFKTNDNVIDVGGIGQPSVTNVESFLVQLSDHVGKEIAGFHLSGNNSNDINHVFTGRYVNNTAERSTAGLNLSIRPDLIGNVTAQSAFHTHLSRFNESTIFNPSLHDLRYKRNQLGINPSLKFYIIAKIGRREF
jgi:RHS repeat-associated protein